MASNQPFVELAYQYITINHKTSLTTINAPSKHRCNTYTKGIQYSVSNVDCMDIYPGHLEQLAIACSNLERINLMNASKCLQSLKCKNIQGINLAGIPTVECHLLLWELLSSVKKLTHLAINLSMLTHHGDYDGV